MALFRWNDLGLAFMVMLALALLGVFVFRGFDSSSSSQGDYCSVHACITKSVHGQSMDPLLRDGDSIRIGIDYYSFFPIARGDVVIIDFNFDDNLRVKRVVGIPGDVIRFDAAGVWVEDWLVIPSSDGVVFPRDAFVFSMYSDAEDPLVIPPGKVFVLGENLGASVDSRQWGLVSQRFLSGKVVEVLPSGS